MLFGWKGATIFQAGPSKAMNWYGTNGTGSHAAAGDRVGDGDAMCGNAVMYDATAGKILVTGGAIDYVYLPAALDMPNTPAHICTARRQCDGKCPHHHHRYGDERSHRADSQPDVLSQNLRKRGRTSNRSSIHLRWPRIRDPILRQRQPAPAGNMGPRLHHLHQTRSAGHTPQLPLHRDPPPRRNRPVRGRRPVRTLRDEPLRRPDLQPGLPLLPQRQPSPPTRHRIRPRTGRRRRNVDRDDGLARHGLGHVETRLDHALGLPPILSSFLKNIFDPFSKC